MVLCKFILYGYNKVFPEIIVEHLTSSGKGSLIETIDRIEKDGNFSIQPQFAL